MKRELTEELGYAVRDLRHISTFYTTPGASSERIWLYLAEVDESDRVSAGGGEAQEGEDIREYVLPVDHIRDAIVDGRIKDAKTLVGLLWLRDEVCCGCGTSWPGGDRRSRGNRPPHRMRCGPWSRSAGLSRRPTAAVVSAPVGT
jgi:hypothetical protein